MQRVQSCNLEKAELRESQKTVQVHDTKSVVASCDRELRVTLTGDKKAKQLV